MIIKVCSLFSLFILCALCSYGHANTLSLPPETAHNATMSSEVSNQKIIDAMTQCYTDHTIASDRLSCYDQIISNAVDQKTLKALNTSDTAWQISKNAYKILAGTPSTRTETTDSHFENTTASLFVRCENGQSNIFIAFTDKVMQPNQTIEADMSYDDGRANAMTWTASSTGRSIGLWTTQDALNTLSIMTEHKTLNVNITEPNGKILSTRYDLNGIEEFEKKIQKCQ